MSTRIIGHRGASGYRPEHTEAAYRLAIELGVDALEPDLVLSRDGVVIIRHEHDLSHSTDVADRSEFADRQREGFGEDGPVIGWFTEDFDWAELATLRAREPRPTVRPQNTAFDDAQGIMRFRDLLDLLAEPHSRGTSAEAVQLVAELKHTNAYAALGMDLVGAVLSELTAAGWRPDDPRLIFESFEAEPLDALAGWGKRVLLIDEAHWPADLIQAAKRFDGVSFDTEHLLLEPDLPARLHEQGLLAFAYTLRPENAFLPERYRTSGEPSDYGNWREWFELVLHSGLDAVFVDHPDLPGDVVGPDA
ncbi:MAG: glycerophosphodiester phosphodiesterase family protein [Agromyces sp.]